MSLKYRFALTIFLLEAVLISVVLWQSLSHSLIGIREQLAYTDSVYLDHLASMGLVALVTEEFGGLQANVEKLSKDPRIRSSHLIDGFGRVVASDRIALVGSPPPDLVDSEDVYWKTGPVIGASGELGRIAVEFSNAALVEAIREARNLGIGIAVTGMILIAVAGIVMGYLLTRRLAALSTMADRLATGEFNFRVSLPGRDEIARIGQAFNAMGDSISKTLNTKNSSYASSSTTCLPWSPM
jgi:methyl-accepting chemotaxis protein